MKSIRTLRWIRSASLSRYGIYVKDNGAVPAENVSGTPAIESLCPSDGDCGGNASGAGERYRLHARRNILNSYATSTAAFRSLSPEMASAGIASKDTKAAARMALCWVRGDRVSSATETPCGHPLH